MPSFRVAMLGLAHVHVRDHLAVIAEDPGLRLATAWDPDPERGRSLPPEVIAGDPQAAVRSADLVVVDSVTSAHSRLVPMAARAGKPVFVEKPLGCDGGEARRLAMVVDQAGVPFATGFFLRCLPALRRARELLEAGRLGRLVRVHARFGHSGLSDGAFGGTASWMLDPGQAGVGGFGDLGTHLLDALLWLRPGRVLEVRRARMDRCPGLRLETGGSASLAWDDEVPATVVTSWDSRPGGLRMVIEGTTGAVLIRDGTLTEADGRSWSADGPDAKGALRAFVADLRDRSCWEAPSTSQAVRVARLLDDAYRVAEEGTVRPPG